MEFPNLYRGLQMYSAELQNVYKRNVQVDTGQLRDSIKVWCELYNNKYELHISLRNYWKWIPETFPWNKALVTAGLPENPNVRFGGHSKGWDTGARYPVRWEYWQNYLNDCFEKDVLLHLNGELE